MEVVLHRIQTFPATVEPNGSNPVTWPSKFLYYCPNFHQIHSIQEIISVSKNLPNVDKKKKSRDRYMLKAKNQGTSTMFKDAANAFTTALNKFLVIKMTTKNNGRSGFYFILFNSFMTEADII